MKKRASRRSATGYNQYIGQMYMEIISNFLADLTFMLRESQREKDTSILVQILVLHP